MTTLVHRDSYVAHDATAIAIEALLRAMEKAGHGEMNVDSEAAGVRISFGRLTALGETYEIALVKMAGTVLDDKRLGHLLLPSMRRTIPL